MKKVLLVLALVVAYGVSTSNASTKVITAEKSQVSVVADSDDFSPVLEEEEKDKKKAKKATGEKPSTGCSDAQKKSCAASGKTCGDAKATTEKKACGDAKATTTATTTTKACCGTKK